MNTNKIFYLFAALLLCAAGCHYNEQYFDGYDDVPITDLVQYEGVYTGNYPAEGYFTDRGALATAVNTMMKGIYSYCDPESSARVSVLYGDEIPGLPSPDERYTLTTADYDDMGTGNGQPGANDRFEAGMNVDSYLITFCNTKYAALAEGKIAGITYQFYSGSATESRTGTYKKESTGFAPVQMEKFAATINYVLDSADYKSMGKESGQPGRYYNFDANMDIDHYLTVFLKTKFTYATAGSSAEVKYKYYANSTTTEPSRIYLYDGNRWTFFDPYASTMDVTVKIAEMRFDGANWVLVRLLGGSVSITMANDDYGRLVEWVKANKPEYMSTQNDQEEYYFGASARYFNINNAYNTWKNYYNIGDEYTGKTNDEIQAIMDSRLAEGIAGILLPVWVPAPDPGLAYVVVYQIYGGRGNGMYARSFMYNEAEGVFEAISSVVKQ